jgi:hypothetical protein
MTAVALKAQSGFKGARTEEAVLKSYIGRWRVSVDHYYNGPNSDQAVGRLMSAFPSEFSQPTVGSLPQNQPEVK